MNKEQIAEVAHEVNRAYCQALGDESQSHWENAPQWQKDSAISGVNLHIKNPDAGPEESHNSWLAQKQREGWVYGETKDPIKKEHPCMVPFSHLPVEQQAKDYIFRSIVHILSGLLVCVILCMFSSGCQKAVVKPVTDVPQMSDAVLTPNNMWIEKFGPTDDTVIFYNLAVYKQIITQLSSRIMAVEAKTKYLPIPEVAMPEME